MAWFIYLVVCFITCISSAASMECSGSMRLDIPYAKMEELLMKLEVQADVIQSIKTEQDNMKRDHDNLKEHILKRLDAIDEKTEWFLTQGQQGVHPLSERISHIEAILNKTVTFKDCQERYDLGFKKSGVFTITVAGTPRDVYCEQDLDGGGWTVFQARKDGSIDFYRFWADYKRGFGHPSGEFWLGNEFIHFLTRGHDQELKIELKYNTETAYADYSSFWIEDESQWNKLNVSSFSGANPPDDSFMSYHNGMSFTTRDRDNDPKTAYNCAVDRHGAWWYKECTDSNLNGQYGSSERYKTLSWYKWKGSSVSLTGTRMMVRKRK